MLPRHLHPNMFRIQAQFQQPGAKLTVYDLELRVFVDARNIRSYIKILRDQKELYIHSWRKDAPQGRWVPVYAWGNFDDAVKPDRRTQAELRRKSRAKEGQAQKEAARKRADRALGKLDPTKSLISLTLGI